MRAKIGKGLLTIVALITGIVPYVADWNETHIYNPKWPPHAKFHNGQTMVMGSLLGLGTQFVSAHLRVIGRVVAAGAFR